MESHSFGLALPEGEACVAKVVMPRHKDRRHQKGVQSNVGQRFSPNGVGNSMVVEITGQCAETIQVINGRHYKAKRSGWKLARRGCKQQIYPLAGAFTSVPWD